MAPGNGHRGVLERPERRGLPLEDGDAVTSTALMASQQPLRLASDDDQNDYCILINGKNAGVIRGVNQTRLYILMFVCGQHAKDERYSSHFDNGGLACNIFVPLLHKNDVHFTLRADPLRRLDSD